jgi:3-hydroxyisobutyrate dehydrogenase-like beta-hydroxyacid dehydrogenase
VTAIGLEAGHATTVKLVRSAYMKGRDALVVETLVAARRLGVLDAVLDSIRGPGEEVPFRQLADRLLGGVALHADRRAGELADAAAVLSAAGVEPLLADAGTVRLRRVAASGEAPARRPDGLAEFLPLIDARLGSELDDSGGRAAPS